MTFVAILRAQWHWLRTPLMIVTIAMVIAPSLGLTGLLDDAVRLGSSALIERGEIVGALLAGLAVVAGAVAAHVSWSVDDRAGHAYTLSLPIDRSAFLRQRALATLVLLLIPTLGIAIGVIIAANRIELAPGIRAYPAWIAFRAFAAMALAFSVVFMVRFGLSRRAARVFVIAVMSLFALSWLETQFRPSEQRPVGRLMTAALAGSYSPLKIVFGNWRIIDA